jgi:hypothetical protein
LVDRIRPLGRADLHPSVNGLRERLHIDVVPLVHFGDGIAKLHHFLFDEHRVRRFADL